MLNIWQNSDYNFFFLTEEDKYNIYSPLLFNYFLAEGIVSGHALLVASAKEDPADILQVQNILIQYYILNVS